MAHVNQQVRDAVKSGLEDTNSFGAVFTNRSADLGEADLPAAVVGTAEDQVEERDKDGMEARTLTLTVVLVADGDSETLDDDMDDLRTVAEGAIPDALSSLAHVVEHTGGELDMGTDEDGARWFAFYALSWRIEFLTQKGVPEVAL